MKKKIREFKNGQNVMVINRIFCSKKGDVLVGRSGIVQKVTTCPDRNYYGGQSLREARGHTQLVKVRFSIHRTEVVSGWYLKGV